VTESKEGVDECGEEHADAGREGHELVRVTESKEGVDECGEEHADGYQRKRPADARGTNVSVPRAGRAPVTNVSVPPCHRSRREYGLCCLDRA